MNSDFNINADPKRINLLAEKFPNADSQSLNTLVLFVQAAHEVYNGVSSRLSEYGLSVGNLKILMPLFLHERALTPSELAEYSGVTRSTVTSVIDKLERDGIIRRSTLTDRRMTAISLTNEGKQLMTERIPLFMQLFADLMNEFTQEDHDLFATLLQKLSSGVERIKQE
ncbi:MULTISPECIES: MarR family winged helix-turn-helix transcriptional regulator [Paenibacillus]|uniref:Transcriptional regulator n=1 Tax=Paenibacillus polymyxa TaxID=1406 RepID=A0ABX2Z9W5_PAEPO|nr:MULTISPECIES: MarR family transcriptional regulator [Paenibacillus]ODA06692.1 transcriptional regulator [Paenibacillus polymyxa]OME70916.1 transcriptional regulator [Paenibacillus peoriae]OMF29227.1 transcriptional regulator [Paenibacillus peoriae]